MKTYKSYLGWLALSATSLVLPMQILGLPQVSVAQNADTVGTQVYDKASPAVVSIRTKSASGSGFIVSEDGLTLTNAHVLADVPVGATITVILADGRRLPGKVVGFGENGLDLAALKISNQSKLPTVKLAAPSSVKVGQSVYAIGTPFGQYNNTFTSGIVSRLDRPSGIVQHNANIQPGNSGGPLVNSKAEVIGVNSSGRVAQVTAGGQAIGVTDSSIGINFAIDTDKVESFLSRVRQGRVSSVSTLARASSTGSAPKALQTGKSIADKFAVGDSTLSDRSYFKIYTFEGKAGQKESIEMTSSEIDPVLILRNAESTLAQNDDISPTNFNAKIVATLPADGTYTVVANSYGAEEGGSFQLQVK